MQGLAEGQLLYNGCEGVIESVSRMHLLLNTLHFGGLLPWPHCRRCTSPHADGACHPEL